MITTSKDDATGAAFHQAASNTGFGKVFSNNMDNESYVGWSNVISSILNNSKTAAFHFQPTAMTSPELNNCLVSLTISEWVPIKSCTKLMYYLEIIFKLRERIG